MFSSASRVGEATLNSRKPLLEVLQGSKDILPGLARHMRREFFQDANAPGLRVKVAGLGANPEKVPLGKTFRLARQLSPHQLGVVLAWTWSQIFNKQRLHSFIETAQPAHEGHILSLHNLPPNPSLSQ